MRKLIVAISVAAVLAILLPDVGRAALPAPTFLPNSPLVAGSQIIVLWSPVPGAVKYYVYLDGAKVGESPTIQFMLAAPEKGGEYKITLAAVDGAGVEGAKSGPGIVKIVLLEPPKGLMHRYSEGKVQLRWDKVPVALIYNLFRAEKKDGEYKLLSSVQGEAYTDSTVKEGVTYFYAVSAKDLSGKESSRSAPLVVEAKEAVAGAGGVQSKAPKYEYHGAASVPVGKVLFVAGQDMEDLSDMRIDTKTGELFILKGDRILVTRLDGSDQKELPPLEGVRRAGKFDIGPDGTLYVGGGRYLIALSRANGSVIWRSELRSPDAGEKEMWEGVPAQFRTLPPLAELVSVMGEEIWVMDLRSAMFHVYSTGGKFLRYVYGYTDLSGKKGHFSPFSAVMRLGKDRLLLGDSLGHAVLCVELASLKTLYTVGVAAGDGMTGKIVGVNGLYPVPGTENYLVTDAAQQALQVFDKDGKYLYHLAGETGAEDSKMKGRAALDIGSTLLWAQYVNSKEFVVYSAGEKAIFHRKLK